MVLGGGGINSSSSVNFVGSADFLIFPEWMMQEGVFSLGFLRTSNLM
jgi:hypothetical protein